MPQVASDAKTVAPSYALPAPPRPAPNADQAVTPFASLLDEPPAADPPPPAPDPSQSAAADKPTDAGDANRKAKDAGANDAGAKAAAKSASKSATNDAAGDSGSPAAADSTDARAAGKPRKTKPGDGKTVAAAPVAAKTADDALKPAGDKTDSKTDSKGDAAAGSDAGTVQPDAQAVATAIVPAAIAPPQVPVVQQARAATATPTALLPGIGAVIAGDAKAAGKDAATKIAVKDAAKDPVKDAAKDLDAGKAGATDIAGAAHDDGKAQTADKADADASAHAHADTPAHQAVTAQTPATVATDASAAAKAAGAVQPLAANATNAPTNPSVSPPPAPQAAAVPLAGVAIEIASKALDGKNRFEIRLDPPELGRIDVRLDVDRDGKVTSRLLVDRPDTLDLLRQDSAGLQRALQDAGLKTADNGLQFSLRDQSGGGAQNRGPLPGAAQIVADDGTLAAADATPTRYYRLAGTGGGLDIRV